MRPGLVGAGCLGFTGCLLSASLGGLTGGTEAAGGAAADGGDAAPSLDAADAMADASATDGGSDAPAEGAASYSATVLGDDPLLYFRLDEMSGAIAHDLSGNARDGTYVGNVTLGASGATPDGDTSVNLDGTSGTIQASAALAFAGLAAMTLEVWVLPVSTALQYSPVAAKEDIAAPRDGYLLWLRVPSTGSTAGFERWATTANKALTSAALPPMTWHHLVATYDGSNARLYLDGVLQSAAASSLLLAQTVVPLSFGSNAYEGTFYAGRLDEVAVYGHALAANRVLAHYQASGR